MEKILLKYRENILSGLAALLIGVLVAGLGSAILSPKSAGAETGDETDEVTITATIESWASLTLATSTLAFDNVLVDEWGDGNIGTASTTFTAGTNATSGLTVAVKSDTATYTAAALVGQTHGATIDSASSTVVAEADHYGVQCDGDDANTTCDAAFDKGGTDNVSALTTGNVTFATATYGTGRQADLVIKAASLVTKVADTYKDIIILTATPVT